MIAALPIMETLEEAGHEAVFVGGAVRDAVLGLPIQDVDIATSATPEETLALFPKCIPTGLQHGTVTVVQHGMTYEVTTYRAEAAYVGHRKPSEVVFIKGLDEDLLRRDFTMNAMAIQLSGELYDPCGGEGDLRASRLRCVGDPSLRFQEDALRMIRAVRFLGAYRLAPVPSLWRSLKRHAALLRHVAMERVQAELDKMLGSDVPERALIWLAASGLLSHWKEPLPGSALSKMNQAMEEWKGSAGDELQLTDMAQLPVKDERWAAVFLSLAFTGEEAGSVMSQLRFSNKRSMFISAVIDCHERMIDRGQPTRNDVAPLKRAWTEVVLTAGESAARSWLRIARTLPHNQGRLTQPSAALLASWLEDMPAKTLKELAVGGAEVLQRLNRPAGPWLSKTLSRLLLAAASGETANEKDKLLAWAENWNEEDRSDEH